VVSGKGRAMYDPLTTAETTRSIVCSGDRRNYYRFRPAKFYGGIATADCVGCNLRCAFCWSWNVTTRPETVGSFYTPRDVAHRLIGIAKAKKLTRLRISGNEPTLCREHLIKVLELIPQEYLFILETNGILIGQDETYARDLSRFPNLHVRVSLKGTCEEDFFRLTGAHPSAFGLQLKALEHLAKCGVAVHPACMVSFSTAERIKALRTRLAAIHPSFEGFEEEELILYPAVEERLRKMNVDYGRGEPFDRKG
jgi:uncharacterized Fe-S cluster-containing radical SAM superfamily protein